MPALDYPWDDLLESEPWRTKDKEEWDRLESLRALGTAGSRMTTNREKQDVHMHELHLMPCPCWLCGQKNTYYHAMGKVLVPYIERKFSCVRCGVELHHVVPFMAAAGPWYWGRPNDIKAATVIHHAELWQEVVVQRDRPTMGEVLGKAT